MVLGTPLGTPQYQQHQLQQLRAQHDQLLDRIPALGDLQASWLLLLFCASPRCSETVMARLPQPGTKTIKNAKMLGERHLGRET